MADIGIIGGSGLYKLEAMEGVKEVAVKTPFGSPSDKIITGRLCGVSIAFLARHNRRHIYLPSEVPYRANIYALKSLGVKTVLAFGAVGSLKEELAPGTLVFPDQIIDKTYGREQTFFGKGIVAHAAFAHPFCVCVQEVLFKEAKKLKIKSSAGGALVCMEGPCFSAKAESEWHRKMGWSLIGMTSCPEAKLAREAGLPYGYCAMVTDYDGWKEGEEVTAAKVTETMKFNEFAAKKLLTAALPKIARLKLCGVCAASRAVPGHLEGAPKAQLAKIKLVLK